MQTEFEVLCVGCGLHYVWERKKLLPVDFSFYEKMGYCVSLCKQCKEVYVKLTADLIERGVNNFGC